MPAPVNDNFANRITITGASGSVAPVSVTLATVEASEPTTSQVTPGTIWFQFTPATTGIYEFRATGTAGLDPGVTLSQLVNVYTGTALASLVAVSTIDDNSDFTANYTWQLYQLTAGVVYKIQVGFDLSVSVGTGGVQWDFHAPPANDNFANFVELVGAAGTSASYDMTAATLEVDEQDFGFTTTGWFHWTGIPNANGLVLTVNVTVYAGGDLGYVRIFTGGPGLADMVFTDEDDTITVDATIDYWLQVGTYPRQPYSITLTWNSVDPAITPHNASDGPFQHNPVAMESRYHQ